jgi:hypothetical protein
VTFVSALAAADREQIVGNGAALTGGVVANFILQTVTGSAGPNHWDTPSNWLPAGVPVSGDDVRFEFGDVSCLYGLDQSAVTLDALEIASSFTGSIGLPRRTNSGYVEYRTRDLTIRTPSILIGHGNGSSSSKIQLNTLDTQTALEIRNSGGSSEAGVPTILWYGSHASNTVKLMNGDLGIAVWSDQSAVVALIEQYGGTLRVDHTAIDQLYSPGQSISAHESTLGGQPLEL